MNKYSQAEEEYSMLVEKPIDVVGIFVKYLSHWKWFLLSIVVFAAIAAMYLTYKLPQYRVTTSILFKDDQRGGGASEMNLFREMGIITQRNNVDNEIEILTKSLVVEKVVKKLGLYATYTEMKPIGFIQKTGLQKIVPGIGQRKVKILYGDESPVLVHLSESILYTLEDNIVFDVLVKPNGHYEFSGKFLGDRFTIQAAPSDSTVHLPFGSVQVRRGEVAPTEDMIVRIKLSHPINVSDAYLKNLDIELTSLTSSVANLSLTSPNGNMGRDFLKAYIETYNEEGIKSQNELADKTAVLIDNHLSKLSNELSSVESQAQDYMQARGLTDIASQADLYNSQSASVGQRKVDVESQYAIVSNLYDYVLQKNNHDQLIPANSGIRSEALNYQINSYNNLVLQRNRLSRIASSSNQAMIDLNNQIESTFHSVRSGLLNEKNNLDIQQRDLSAVYNQNNARLRAIPRQEREYSDIRRQQNIKEELFLYLLQKKEEKYMNMASVEPNTRLIDNIRIMGIVSPNKILIGFLFFVLALILPIIAIKIEDLLRYQISTKEELEKISSVPVLGEIPYIEHTGHVIIQENNNDSFSEMIRLLRANLLFIVDSKDKKVINMLSSISGEGKTFLTVNLAMSLALLDKKVLIVELDIRKPKLAGYFDVENKNGITMYLSGYLNKEELVKPSGVHPNLSVITAGEIPPNPNELLAKPLLDELIHDLRNDFDYIIIDTAPVGVVSDSFLLDRFADVNLYVVRSGYTPKKYIEDADDYFRGNRLRKMYFILNSVNLNTTAYRYGYGKKYGYGYG
jgi:capsular exopolysaccharide family